MDESNRVADEERPTDLQGAKLRRVRVALLVASLTFGGCWQSHLDDSCENDLIECDDTCVSAYDARHCGACGVACVGNEICMPVGAAPTCVEQEVAEACRDTRRSTDLVGAINSALLPECVYDDDDDDDAAALRDPSRPE